MKPNIRKSQNWLHSFLLILLLGLALGLRLPFLDGSFWLDEAAQALESTRPWYLQLTIAQDFQPPLLHLIVHLVQYVSHAEWWLRLFGAVIPGLISIYYAIKIAKRYVGFTESIWLGLLLATNSFHVFFSQELRPYALPAAFASASWWVLLQFLEKDKKKFSLAYTLLTLGGL